MAFDISGLIGPEASKQFTSNPAWAPSQDNNQGQVQQGLQVFQQSFQNLVGRPPTQQEMADFATNSLFSAWNQPGNLTYSDTVNSANAYIQNAFGPQVAQNQQTQQTNQLGQTEKTIQDLIQKQMASAVSDITNPSSPTYQTFAGNMNNLGITPSSGAFQAGLGGTLGQNASNSINAALGAVGLPAISNIQGLTSLPLNVSQSFNDLSHQNQLQDWQLQEQLNQKLFDESQPSGLTTALGQAGMATKALGNLSGFMPVGSGAGPTSWVCMELIRQGLLCQQDLDDFHVHIMPALFKKGRAFWKYAMDGKNLVDAVNARGLNWKVFKPLLFDRVMDEKDPVEAVDLYADACHQLCISSDRTLWDSRVHRSSILDSLLFLPLLFLYTPFLKALAKCLRRKILLVYDKPRCAHGS